MRLQMTATNFHCSRVSLCEGFQKQPGYPSSVRGRLTCCRSSAEANRRRQEMFFEGIRNDGHRRGAHISRYEN